MMGITEMTLPMNTSLNVTVSLGVRGGGGAAETVGNAPDTEAVVVGIGAGLDANVAAAAAAALLLVFLRIVVLFLGLTGAVKH